MFSSDGVRGGVCSKESAGQSGGILSCCEHDTVPVKEGEGMNVDLTRFPIDKHSPFALLCIGFLVLSSVFVILGTKGKWRDLRYVITQVVMMVLAAFLLIVYILFFSQHQLWLTSIPFLLALVSLMFKLFLNPRFQGALHHVLTVLLYSALLAVWILTMTGVIWTKWILFGLIALPLLIHIFGEDLPILIGKANPISYVRWMQEGALLSMMLSMLYFILAIEHNP